MLIHKLAEKIARLPAPTAPAIEALIQEAIAPLLQASQYTYLDCSEILPAFDPSGHRFHSGWASARELGNAIALFDPEFELIELLQDE